MLAAGGMIIFLAYEGFELIANSARDVRDVGRTLPRAYYTAVGSVMCLYVLVALVTVGSLGGQDRGSQGLRAGGSGSTTSRAGRLHSDRGRSDVVHRFRDQRHTLRCERLSYCIARHGELPATLERKLWGEPMEGLLIAAGLTLLGGQRI
jgi:Amino acid permease